MIQRSNARNPPPPRNKNVESSMGNLSKNKESSNANSSQRPQKVSSSLNNRNQLTTNSMYKKTEPVVRSNVASSRSVSSFNKPPLNQETSNLRDSQQLKRQGQKSKGNSQGQGSSQKSDSHGIFYSELNIDTYDKDVPHVRILKLQQQLQNRYVYYSTYIEQLMQTVKLRAMTQGFRAISVAQTRAHNLQAKVTKLTHVLRNCKLKRQKDAFLKVYVSRQKFHVKVKAALVVHRLIATKINSNWRQFIKLCSENKLLKMTLDKSDEEESVKLKMDLEIFKHLTFSKEFIQGCKALAKISKNRLTVFDQEITKVSFEDNLQKELQRYSKVRQNVDGRNPNQSQETKSKAMVKRKQSTSLTLDTMYENEIVLSLFRLFISAINESKSTFERQIDSFKEQIESLQTQQRYLSIKDELKFSESIRKAYESLINEFYNKGDEQIRKIVVLLQDPKSRNTNQNINRLISTISTQKDRYQKLHLKIENNQNSEVYESFLSKMYQSRCWMVEVAIKLSKQHEGFGQEIKYWQDSFQRLYGQVKEILKISRSEAQLKQFIGKNQNVLSQGQEEDKSSEQLVGCIASLIYELLQQIRSVRQESTSKQSGSVISRTNSNDRKPPQGPTPSKGQTGEIEIQYRRLIEFCEVFYELAFSNDSEKSKISSLKKSFERLSKDAKKGQTQYSEQFSSVQRVYSEVLHALNSSSASEKDRAYQSLLTQYNLSYELTQAFYELALTKESEKAKYTEAKKCFEKFSKTAPRSSEFAQHHSSIAGVFNEVLILLKSSSVKSEKLQEESCSQFKDILKQKLQIEKRMLEYESKYQIKSEEYKVLEKSLKDIQAKHISTDQENKDLENQVKSLERKLELSDTATQRLKEELEVYKVSIKSQQQESSKLKRELNAHKSQVISLQQQNERLNKKISQSVSLEKNRKGVSAKDYKYLEKTTQMKITQYEKQQEKWTIEQSSLQTEIFNLKDQLLEYQRTVGEYRNNETLLHEQLQKSNGQNRTMKNSEKTFQKTIDKLRKENLELQQSLQETLKNSQANMESINSNSNQLNVQITALQSQNKQLIQHSQAIEFQKLEISKRLERTIETIDSLSGRLERLDVELANKQTQYAQRLETETYRLQSEQRLQTEQLNLMIGNLETKEEHQNQIVRELETKIEGLIDKDRQAAEQNTVFNITSIYQQELKSLEANYNKELESLRSFVSTLQQENSRISSKCGQLRVQLTTEKEAKAAVAIQNTVSSESYYENLISDLRKENEAYSFEVRRLKFAVGSQNQSTTVFQEQLEAPEKNAYLVNELKAKQTIIFELESQLQEVKHQLRSVKSELQFQAIDSRQRPHSEYLQKEGSTEEIIAVKELQAKLLIKEKRVLQLSELNGKVVRDFQSQQQEHEKVKNTFELQIASLEKEVQELSKLNIDYPHLLRTSEDVRQLFMNLIESTQQINSRLPSFQSSVSNQQIVQLIQEFKTVIENNHETLKTIYETLINHPYNNAALELSYLKELAQRVIGMFLEYSPNSFYSSALLEQELQKVFAINGPTIEGVFVGVEDFMVYSLHQSLSSYKEQLSFKAMELDYWKSKLSELVERELIEADILQNKFVAPAQNSSFLKTYSKRAQTTTYGPKTQLSSKIYLKQNTQNQRISSHNQERRARATAYRNHSSYQRNPQEVSNREEFPKFNQDSGASDIDQRSNNRNLLLRSSVRKYEDGDSSPQWE